MKNPGDFHHGAWVDKCLVGYDIAIHLPGDIAGADIKPLFKKLPKNWKNDKPAPDGSVKCRYCKRLFPSKGRLASHLRQDRQKPTVCERMHAWHTLIQCLAKQIIDPENGEQLFIYNMIGWFPLFKGLRMKEKAYRLAGENEGRFNTGKLCRFCGTFIDFSSFNSQYQSKLMRQHLQEFHSHNATNPATRFFLLRTHKRRGCGTRLQRLYFLDKAYDMI